MATLEIDVLDTQLETLHEAKTSAVEERDHEPGRAVQFGEHGTDLVARQDDRDTNRAPGVDEIVEVPEGAFQHVFVQKEQGAECLVLGGGANVALNCQCR